METSEDTESPNLVTNENKQDEVKQEHNHTENDLKEALDNVKQNILCCSPKLSKIRTAAHNALSPCKRIKLEPSTSTSSDVKIENVVENFENAEMEIQNGEIKDILEDKNVSDTLSISNESSTISDSKKPNKKKKQLALSYKLFLKKKLKITADYYALRKKEWEERKRLMEQSLLLEERNVRAREEKLELEERLADAQERVAEAKERIAFAEERIADSKEKRLMIEAQKVEALVKLARAVESFRNIQFRV